MQEIPYDGGHLGALLVNVVLHKLTHIRGRIDQDIDSEIVRSFMGMLLLLME